MNTHKSETGVLITGGFWFHETPGGAYKVATEFSEYLAEKDYRVFYLAASNETNVAPVVHNGVEIWRYTKPKAASPSLSNLLTHIRQSRKLAKDIHSCHPIEYINGHDPLQFIGVSWALKPAICQSSFSVHSPLVQEHKAHWRSANGNSPLSLQRTLALKVLSAIEAFVYSRADIVQTDSSFTLQEISRDYASALKDKGLVRNLWVDLDRFQPCADKQAVRGTLGVPWKENIPTFFTIRRLVPRMGLDELIMAMGLLRDRGEYCRLMIGGSGPERKALEALSHRLSLSDRVFFLGRVSDEDLPACYQAADCFMLPTKALECFGLIILEAYASGIPAIATKVGAIPEIVEQLDANFLVEKATSELIALKMSQFLNGEIKTTPSALRAIAERYEYRYQSAQLEKCLFS